MSHDCTLPTPGLFTTTLVCRNPACRRVWTYQRGRTETLYGTATGIATPTSRRHTGRSR